MVNAVITGSSILKQYIIVLPVQRDINKKGEYFSVWGTMSVIELFFYSHRSCDESLVIARAS
jgi:hypothetical protein